MTAVRPAPPGAPAAERRGRGLGALRSRNFRLLWGSLIFSNTGTWMQGVGQGWLVLELTNSPLYLGLVALAFAVPMTLLPPLGGALSDRLDRLWMLRVIESLQMLLAGLLAGLTLLGVVRVWHILTISFLSAVLLAGSNPNRQALLPSLVPREDLMSAISLNSAVFTGAALVGPAIAGFLLVPLGPGGLFALNALSFVAVLVASFLLRGIETRPTKAGLGGLLGDTTAGLRFVFGSRLLVLLVTASALSGLLGRSYASLLPVFARDVWRVGPEGYGGLLSAPGAGALAGAVGLAAVGEVRRKGWLVLGSMLLFAFALTLFALSPLYWPAMGLLLAAGVLNSLFGASIATLIQTHAPGELRGRAMSVYTITIIGLPSLGALLTAVAAEVVGPRGAVGYAAVALAAVTLALTVRGRELRDAR